MQENEIAQQCSILNCTEMALSTLDAQLGPWTVTGHFCREHVREIENGTPVGGLGVDPCRLSVKAAGDVVPPTATTHQLSPQ